MECTRLSEGLAVGPQLELEEIRDVAAAGFIGIINDRPDAEAPDQPTALDLNAEAKRFALANWYIPVAPGAMTQADVRSLAAALREAKGPVLAFCRTGARWTALWKAAEAFA